jgi:putative tryptophan/tyrosine transport system substrate-binding protein
MLSCKRGAEGLGDPMQRRKFITLLGGAAAWPMTASAQQIAIPVMGYLGDTSPEGQADALAGFRRGLSDAGYVEGQTVAVEYRWAEGQYDRLPALADDLVRRQVAVIAAGTSTAAALAAKAATATIPVVFIIGADPMRFGLAASLNRPGGNVTGVTYASNLLVPKRFELLRDLVPSAETLALLQNPNNPNAEFDAADAQTSARSLDRMLQVLRASSVSEIDAAFASLVQQRIGALLLAPDAFLTSRREQIVTLARYHRIPAIYYDEVFATVGGLMSYGAHRAESNRQAGAYVGRILKGEKPGNLPVVQPSKFDLVINLKTAKALDLTVPPSLLATADEVIE